MPSWLCAPPEDLCADPKSAPGGFFPRLISRYFARTHRKGTPRFECQESTVRRGNTPLRWNECRDEKLRERWRAAGEIASLAIPCKPKNEILGKFLKEIF
jgi:hypothetical protein